MTRWLYNVVIFWCKLGIYLAQFCNQKVKKFVQGRKNIFQQLKHTFQNNHQPVVWVHCASLGEFEQGRPLMEALKRTWPSYRLLVTFFSSSGYEIKKNNPLTDDVFYLPIDTANHARNFLQITRPKLIFFIKYEFWYHYLNQAKKLAIPVFLVSAIFRKDQHFFQWYGAFFRAMLKNFQHIFVQNQASVALLARIGIHQVTHSGDTKFDNVQKTRKNIAPIAHIAAFKSTVPLLIIGSCWPEDLAVLLPYINRTQKKMKFIVAPHEIHTHKIAQLQQKFQKPTLRFSQAAHADITAYDVLIIDNVGMLAKLYQYADFAYVGGAFKQGLHNILEPAVFGVPLFFGNIKYQNFQEACDLVQLGGAFSVADAKSFQIKMDEIYENLSLQKAIGEKVANYVTAHTGATSQVMAYLKNYYKK